MIFKKNKLLFYVLIGFVFALGSFFLNNFGYRATFYEEIKTLKKESIHTFNTRLKKDGCYYVGFSSPDINLFSYKIKGQYSIKYYNEDILLKEVNATRTLGSSAFSRSDVTENVLDQVEIPLQGYKNMRIELEVINSDKILLEKEKTIYFFLHRMSSKCKKIDFDAIEKKELIKNHTIDTKEKNSTLVPLYQALKNKDIVKVKKEIKKFGVDVKMSINRTPLHYAAFFNDLETTKYLVDSGASIYKKDLSEKTPIQYAIESNATKTTKFLLDNGIDINKVGYVDNYLKRGDIDIYKKFPPLVYTGCSGLYEMTKLLLDYGVDKKLIYKGHNIYEYSKFICIDEKKISKEEVARLFKLFEEYGFKYKYNTGIKFDKEIK